MSDRVKLFERIAYGGVAFGLLNALIYNKYHVGNVTLAVHAVTNTIILAAAVQLAARRAHHWAAWLLFAYAGLEMFGTISDFSPLGPAWMPGFFKPDTPPTVTKLALDAVESLLFLAAFYFYLTRRGARKSDPIAAG
jgi:hypothetical protein